MNIAVATARLKDQPSSAYISVLPWASSEVENRQFKWLSAGFLALTLGLAMVVKWQELPEPARIEKEKLPPQLTRLIKPSKVEPPKPAEAPKPYWIIRLIFYRFSEHKRKLTISRACDY